jgi:thymidylate synthase (FAD)
MKLIKANYKILTPINGEEILKAIELAARTCYQSDGKIEYEYTKIEYEYTNPNTKEVDIVPHPKWEFYAKSARILIPKLMNLNHEAMLEFGGMIIVRFIVDRGVSHELVRHRLCSFAQESTRYCNYSKGGYISFIIPCWLDIPEYEGEMIPYCNNKTVPMQIWLSEMINIEYQYNSLIKLGWTPQQARSVLPNSLKTEINMSANIREWRTIFKQRTSKMAHPQMREVMCPLLDEFKTKIPILFDDINYERT